MGPRGRIIALGGASVTCELTIESSVGTNFDTSCDERYTIGSKDPENYSPHLRRHTPRLPGELP